MRQKRINWTAILGTDIHREQIGNGTAQVSAAEKKSENPAKGRNFDLTIFQIFASRKTGIFQAGKLSKEAA